MRQDYHTYATPAEIALWRERREELRQMGIRDNRFDLDHLDRIMLRATPLAWRVLMNEFKRQ